MFSCLPEACRPAARATPGWVPAWLRARAPRDEATAAEPAPTLPALVLVDIFGRLDRNDLRRSALPVCRQWFELAAPMLAAGALPSSAWQPSAALCRDLATLAAAKDGPDGRNLVALRGAVLAGSAAGAAPLAVMLGACGVATASDLSASRVRTLEAYARALGCRAGPGGRGRTAWLARLPSACRCRWSARG